MKSVELKEYSLGDLHEKLNVERSSLAKLRFQHGVSGLESPLQIRVVRKDIARILTEINARTNNTEEVAS